MTMRDDLTRILAAVEAKSYNTYAERQADVVLDYLHRRANSIGALLLDPPFTGERPRALYDFTDREE